MNIRILAALLGLAIISFSCQTDQRALVVGKVHKASKLATCQFTVDKIVHGTKTKKVWFLELNEARFLAYSQAIITTGVNLDKLRKEDIDIEGKIISITLPPVQVINFSYPPEKFTVDERITDVRKFLNNISIEDQEKYFRQAEIDIRNNLKYMGVVETTQRKTIDLLTGLLSTMGYNEIHILFKSDSLIVDEVKSELN